MEMSVRKRNGFPGLGPSVPTLEPRPLLIPEEVIEHFLNFCGFQDLKSCRLVCKVWYENSLKHWRSLAKIKLEGGKQMTEFLTGSTKPYAGLSVRGRITIPNPLWNDFGIQISALELKNITFKSSDDLRTVIFQSCPNMTELSLLEPITIRCSVHLVEPGQWVEPQFEENLNLKRLTLLRAAEALGITRMEILSHFPALEVLVQKGGLPEIRSETDPTFGDLFKTVTIIRKHDSNKLQLRNIRDLEIPTGSSFSTGLPASLGRVLMGSPRIPLENLTLVANESSGTVATILKDVLWRHRASLKKLELLRTRGRKLFLDPFLLGFQLIINEKRDYTMGLKYRELPTVEEITLRSRVFSSLQFLRYTPNLKKLTIYALDDLQDDYDNIVKETNMAGINGLIDCIELHLAFELDKDDLQKLAIIFPSVQKLTISLNNELFSIVCQIWPELVELNIFDSSIDATGISKKRIGPAVQSRPGSGVRWSRTPIMSNLKSLRRLSIETWVQSVDTPTKILTRSSALFGFLQVPYLEYLHITNYKVEDEVKEILRAHALSCVFASVCQDMELWKRSLKNRLF